MLILESNKPKRGNYLSILFPLIILFLFFGFLSSIAAFFLNIMDVHFYLTLFTILFFLLPLYAFVLVVISPHWSQTFQSLLHIGLRDCGFLGFIYISFYSLRNLTQTEKILFVIISCLLGLMSGLISSIMFSRISFRRR